MVGAQGKTETGVVGRYEGQDSGWGGCGSVLGLEGALVIGVLAVAVMGTQLPSSLIAARVGPGALLITIVWLAGLWLLDRASKGLPWHEQGYAPGSQPAPESNGAGKKREAKAR